MLASAILLAGTNAAAYQLSGVAPSSAVRACRCGSPVAVAAAPFSLGAYMEEKRLITESVLEASLTSTCKETDIIVESMKYSLMAGGKRVRPMLVFAACEMFGGNIDIAKPTAVGVEMIHTMSLIHDDLPAMDDDDMRRGKPTNHVLYGDDVAILAGDAMLSEAFAHVARETKGVPAERIVKVLQIMGDCVGPLGLAGGQVLDLKSEGKPDVGMETLTWIHTHKTAALLKAAVASGAILAGATDADVEKCNEYALKIGLAFQVRAAARSPDAPTRHAPNCPPRYADAAFVLLSTCARASRWPTTFWTLRRRPRSSARLRARTRRWTRRRTRSSSAWSAPRRWRRSSSTRRRRRSRITARRPPRCLGARAPPRRVHSLTHTHTHASPLDADVPCAAPAPTGWRTTSSRARTEAHAHELLQARSVC